MSRLLLFWCHVGVEIQVLYHQATRNYKLPQKTEPTHAQTHEPMQDISLPPTNSINRFLHDSNSLFISTYFKQCPEPMKKNLPTNPSVLLCLACTELLCESKSAWDRV